MYFNGNGGTIHSGDGGTTDATMRIVDRGYSLGVAIGSLRLPDDLKPGEWRDLTKEEPGSVLH